MTEIQPDYPDFKPQPAEATVNSEDLVLSLRRKQGTWVEWGQACQQLQKAGYSPQKIFEETGFEPIHQNQVIVGSQVYTTMVNSGVSAETRSHFERKGSDILYELRILTTPERAAAAEYIVSRNLDVDGAKEVAKAIKEFSRRSTLPPGFTDHPGDAVAYQYWRLAQQHNDLQERSRWIARGLMFAHSQTARNQVEKLLTDLANPQIPAPTLPLYRLELEEELPRMIPVAGQIPVSSKDLLAVPTFEAKGQFQLVQSSWQGNWVALPGWQVALKADSPVVVVCLSNQLPVQPTGRPEEVLVLIDRTETQWDANSFFAVDNAGEVQFQWFPEKTDLPILGKIVLILRPKRIVDEGINRDVWQIDE